MAISIIMTKGPFSIAVVVMFYTLTPGMMVVVGQGSAASSYLRLGTMKFTNKKVTCTFVMNWIEIIEQISPR